MRIEKLTQLQEMQLIEHRNEYLKRGLSTDSINKNLTKESISRLYKNINKPEPYFWFCESPMMCQLIINILKNANLRDNISANLRDNLRANLYDNLSANLYANLGDNISANLRDNLRANLRVNLYANLSDNLYDNLSANLSANLRVNLYANLRDNLRANLYDNLSANLRVNLLANLEYVSTCFWGNMDNHWIAYYQYPRKYLNLDYKELGGILDIWDDIGKSCSWWYPFENIVFVSDRPCEIHKNAKGQLHKDSTPALLFMDGYCLWMLNGVSVPKYLVETPEDKLDIDFFKKEKNADVKAEFIRKYGIERMVSLGEKICDVKEHLNEYFRASEYELYNMGGVFNRDYAPFLKMKNLTTGTWHFEGVSPECKTVEDALKFRAKNRIIKLEGVK